MFPTIRHSGKGRALETKAGDPTSSLQHCFQSSFTWSVGFMVKSRILLKWIYGKYNEFTLIKAERILQANNPNVLRHFQSAKTDVAAHSQMDR